MNSSRYISSGLPTKNLQELRKLGCLSCAVQQFVPSLEFGVVLSLNSTNQLAYLNVLAGGINAFSFYDKLRVVGSKFNDITN